SHTWLPRQAQDVASSPGAHRRVGTNDLGAAQATETVPRRVVARRGPLPGPWERAACATGRVTRRIPTARGTEPLVRAPTPAGPSGSWRLSIKPEVPSPDPDLAVGAGRG